MTPRRIRLLIGAAVVAIVGLFAATDVKAQAPPFPLEGIQFGRTCNDNFVFVTAGPDGDGLDAVFPRLITNGSECPDGPPCLGWEYRWKIDGLDAKFGFNELHVSAATHIPVLGCDPECHNHEPEPAAAERFISFNTNSVRDFTGTFYTPVGVGPGPMSAKFAANTSPPGKKDKARGICAIIGANKVGQEPELPTTLSVVETVVIDDEGNTCDIERIVDFDNCQFVGENAITEVTECGTFKITIEDLKVDGDVATSIDCKLVFTQTGSFRYCYPNSVGSMTCITF